MPSTRDIRDKTSGYDARINEWRKVRDGMEGEDAVKRRQQTYLPQPKGQDPDAYDRYLDRAVFYGVSDRTARGLVGLVFRIAPSVELPARIEYLERRASPGGHPLDTMLRDATREVITLGRYGLLVDMGQSDAGIAEAQPFLAAYPAESIWRWDEVLDPAAGTRRLTRVILEERPSSRGDVEVTFLRELYLEPVARDENEEPTAWEYRQQLWRSVDTDTAGAGAADQEGEIEETEGFERFGDPVTPTMSARPLEKIPFWFLNTYNLLPEPEKPPFLDLVNINMAHYRNSADYEQLLHLVASPTPWVAANWDSADTPMPTTIGAGTFWKLPLGAQTGVLEFSGASAEAFERAMERKEGLMAALGARLIQDRERSNVAADTVRMQGEGQTSVLLSAVHNVEQGFEAALGFLARWAGLSDGAAESVTVELNKDFFGAPLTPQEIDSLVRGWQSGAYSKQTLHENLQRGEVIDPKRSLEEEQALIEDEAPEEPPAQLPPTDEELA